MLQVGHVLEGRYRIVSLGMPLDIGTEYKAYDTQLDRLVVVLLLDRRFGAGAEVEARLTRLQQSLSDLTEPALLPTEQIGVFAGQLYLVRSHIEGHTLDKVLQRLDRLETRKAIEIGIRLCETIAIAHRAHLIHGGLSPHSIVVGDDGSITITDVGLLPALRPVPAPPNQPWGRFPYISPEQAAGEAALPASDVYTIGSLLYEMLTGRPPFRGSDETILALQHLRHDPPSLQVLVPEIPLSLAQIVHKALAKEPAARYRNAGQLAHLLRAHFDPLPAPRSATTPTPRPIPAGGKLVVPPPPSPVSPARPVDRFYGPDQRTADWVEESGMVDWLMIGLLIVALIAVLGLIPLWRTVYRRYAAPPPPTTPASYQWPQKTGPGHAGFQELYVTTFDQDPRQTYQTPQIGLAVSGTTGPVELVAFRLVWYNLILPRSPGAEAVHPNGRGRIPGFGSPAYGVWDNLL